MAALIHALDTYTPKQTGENGHVEHSWSNDIQERIMQLSFQLVRTNKSQMENLSKIFNGILLSLSGRVSSKSLLEREKGIEYLTIVYKMIGQTRDIIDGKGEYSLTYMMIYELYSFYPKLALFAIKCLVDFGDNGKTHQYGSWKDIKYLCHYCKCRGASVDHELIKYSIQLVNAQLREDAIASENGNGLLSLVSKWVPREKSTFGWIYTELACDYFNNYIKSAKTVSLRKATLKCLTDYRKLLSSLNKKLDTLQIKQCDKRWSEIDFKNVTSISNSKQKLAFLNITKENVQRSEEEDRIQCAIHFKEHIMKATNREIEIKGKRVGMEDFTKQALDLLIRDRDENVQVQIDLLNSQWRDSSSLTGKLDKMIAMVDVSGSMNGDPMNVAIALGIRVAEKSVLGKRVMTFSSVPTWCNLEHTSTFVEMVNVVKNADWGTGTNFYSALKTILQAIIDNKLMPEEVEGMVLAIFSDMLIDNRENYGLDLFSTIVREYADAGIKLHGKPFQPPHILFWNLRSTNGFPCLSSVKNASMMTGFNPSLLNLFCEKGIEAFFQSFSPWTIFLESLQNPRYNLLGDKIKEIF